MAMVLPFNSIPSTLPAYQSDLVQHSLKDPYLFDFLGTADPRREREVEQALTDHIQRFLLELGKGFAFVGRQVHLEFASADYYLDLLFYHLKLRRYVVVELKAVPFDAGFVGTLNMYLSAVDDLLRHPDDKPSIGLLLCRSKNQLVAEQPYEPTAIDIRSEITNLKNSGAEVVVLYTTPGFTAQAVRNADRLGWKPQYNSRQAVRKTIRVVLGKYMEF